MTRYIIRTTFSVSLIILLLLSILPLDFKPILASTDPISYIQTTDLPTVLRQHSSIVVDDHIYVLGGYSDSLQDKVYMSTISNEGSLGSWTETTSLPTPRGQFSVVESQGYLFVIGGVPDNMATTVINSKINNDGSLGAWNYVNSLPSGRVAPAAVSHNNYIYVIDGLIPGPSHPCQTTIYYTYVNADGTLNSWETTEENTWAREDPCAVVQNGWIYLFGGYDNYVSDSSDRFHTEVERAQINIDGTLGTWTVENYMNTARAYVGGARLGNKIYALGGIADNQNVRLSSVECAISNADGTLSDWEYTTDYPFAFCSAGITSGDTSLYITGGYLDSYVSPYSTNNVYYISTASTPEPQEGKIIFASGMNPYSEIYMMNPDGSDKTQLTDAGGSNRRPGWSRDMEQYVFQSDRDGNWEIYLDSNLEVIGDEINITNDGGKDEGPVMSPDGSTIAFFSYRDGDEEIFVIDSDGTNSSKLTDNPYQDEDPDWHPSGNLILFRSNRDHGVYEPHEVYLMNSDGSDQHPLTFDSDNFDDVFGPVWSPDGTKIAFGARTGGTNAWDGNLDIWIADYDTQTDDLKNFNRITNHIQQDNMPAWSPDGTQLTFHSIRDGNWEIYTIEIEIDPSTGEGKNLQRLTTFSGYDVAPDWGWPKVSSAPVADVGGPYTGDEGSPISFNASASYDPDGDPLLYRWDFDNNGTMDTEWSDDPYATYTWNDDYSGNVTLEVSDGSLIGSDTTSVQINNVAPGIDSLSFTSPINENGLCYFNASFTDPGTLDTHTATIDWGDGSNEVISIPLGDRSFSASHLYLDDDPSGTSSDDYIISVTITDDDLGSDTASTAVTVNNVAPVIGAIVAPIDPIKVGTPISVSATFSDIGTLDTHTAIWDWGDGTTSAGTIDEVNGSGTVTGSHVYSEAGVYTLSLTLYDDDTGSDYSVFYYVVVYDPDAGFVTGGGWIDSPTGAYAPNPSLTGKATFGFVSKYKKGQITPDGNTEFQFKAGDLNFHSTSYDWLVIAGKKAMYKGTGTINGEGNYGFILMAIDEALTPSTDVDLFRIKIWDLDTGEIIYDNQLGATDDADPTTQIGGGSIVIHNK